jgi:SnoaL-like domain
MGAQITATEAAAIAAQLSDRIEIVDAVLRFGAGQDYASREVYESAFTEDAVLDFAQPAARFGVTFPPMEGRTTIMQTAYLSTQTLVTTHTVTNPRIAIDGDVAKLWALVEAQHVLPDQPHRHLLPKNLFEVDLRREEPGWRMSRLRIENLWHDGDPAVLFQS